MNKIGSSPRKLVTIIVLGAIWIGIVNTWWPGVIPLETFGFWKSKTNIFDWAQAGLPIFGWGALVQLFLEVRKNYQPRRTFLSPHLDVMELETPSNVFVRGMWISLRAGITEEIGFRWIIFLSSIVAVKITNFLIFGWLGFGLTEWLFVNLFRPLADWMTLNYLHAYLFHPSGWAVASAMLLSNAFFRDGHKYQGWFGVIDAWFFGMFCFWIMFTHGLGAAIVVHVVYDMMIFTIIAIAAVWRKRSRSPF